MRPLTTDYPKPLLKIGKLTLLDHLVSKFPKEINELIIVIRYLGDKIMDHCGSKFYSRKVTYVRQSDNVKGTYAALKACQNLLIPGEKFFVFYADDLIDNKCIKECLNYKKGIVVSKVKDATKFGVVQLRPDGSLLAILEKPERPPTDLALTSVMLLDTEIFNYYPGTASNGDEYLSVAIEKMAKDHFVNVIFTDKWIPIGFPEDLIKAEQWFDAAHHKC